MKYELKTVRGYDFYQVSSSLQKAIRRGDKLLAGYFALELFASGYSKYVWKRLYTISAEDIYEPVTAEIDGLYRGFCLVNDKKNLDGKEKGRIFISKAVVLLCDCKKSRETDHLQCLTYDKHILINKEEIENYLKEVDDMENVPIPDYAFDVHTLIGKRHGKTKIDFFIEEHNALSNRQMSLFDNIMNKEELIKLGV